MPTIMQEADFTDQTGIFDPRQFVSEVTVIGCGGIGASALPTLVTLGISHIHLWDPDSVEPRNVASQLLYRPEDVSRSKVEVAKELLCQYGAQNVVTHPELFVAEQHGDDLEGIVISAVDSMTARQDIWQAVKDNPLVDVLIDGRIGGETYTLIVVDPLNDDHTIWYEKFQLHSDEHAMPLPCAERAVVYPAVALGAHITAAITRFARDESSPRLMQQNMRTGEVIRIEH